MVDQSVPIRAIRRINPLVMIALMLVPLLIILGLGLALLESNRGQITNGPAPDFVIKSYEGVSFSLSEQRGKIIVINFWGSWCAPCQAEAPDLNAVYAEYKDRGVIMVGIGYLDTEANAKKFISEHQVKYMTGHDDGSKITAQYGTRQVPETFVIDQQGNIAQMFPGQVKAADLRAVLDRLLSSGTLSAARS